VSEHEILVRNAIQFLEVGGSISYAEWLGIPFDHRNALIEAQESVEARVSESFEEYFKKQGTDTDADADADADTDADERGSCLAVAERLVGV